MDSSDVGWYSWERSHAVKRIELPKRRVFGYCLHDNPWAFLVPAFRRLTFLLRACVDGCVESALCMRVACDAGGRSLQMSAVPVRALCV